MARLPDDLARNEDTDSYNNGSLLSIPSADIKTSTPREIRSKSCLDITTSNQNQSTLSNEFNTVHMTVSSWQRLRGLSQSISDLNALKAKQKARQESNQFDDNFLEEHARKLQEARGMMKALDAKYCKPQRYRSHSSITSGELAKGRGITAGRERSSTNNACQGLVEKTQNINNNTEKENKILRDKPKENVMLQEITPSSGLIEDSGKAKQDFETSLTLRTHEFGLIGRQTKRPMTWAFDVEETDGPPSLRANSWFHGSQDFQNRSYMDNGYWASNDDSLRPSYDKESTKKWQSMPNLGNNNNNIPQDRELMYGEAIPVDPDDDSRPIRQKKLGRKSKMYVVTTSQEELKVENQKKKQKITKKLFQKNRSLKKLSLKRSDIGDPKEIRPLGKILGSHPTTKGAYTIELNKPKSGSYGFSLQNGYQNKKGIFISKIRDKKTLKFFGGLLHVGDEVLEMNNNSLKEQTYPTVKKIMKNSKKLVLTIWPSSSRKDAS